MDDEQSTAAVTRVCKVHWVDEAADNFDELDSDVAGERPTGSCYRFVERRETRVVCILRRRRNEQPPPD